MKNSAFIKLAEEADSQYVDIYTQYGVSFIKGAYLQLLKRSASKSYVENDSSLDNGVQMVAKQRYGKYQKKSVSVQFLLEASDRQQYVSRVEGFIDKISQGLFCLKIPSLYRVFRLVYTDIKIKQEFRNNHATFTLEMVEPNPMDRVNL